MRSRHRRLRYELLETRELLATVQISDAVVAHSAERVTVPVNIDDATGVRAAEIRIEYDTSQLNVQPKDIAAGSAWDGKALAISKIDEPAGVIVVFVFATEDLESGSGSLLDVSFTIRNEARATKAAVDLAEVRLNEGQIALTTSPVTEADSTDGLRREPNRQHDRSSRDRQGSVCVAEVRENSQVSLAHPVEYIAPTQSLRSTLSDKTARLRRDIAFVGPIADYVYADPTRWWVWP